MLYRVKLYTPSQYERCHEVTKTCVVGSKRAAELQAEAWLPPTYETVYMANIKRFPIVYVHDIDDNLVDSYDTPINYVPSVGELGWTP
jgi:hypothetical protein